MPVTKVPTKRIKKEIKTLRKGLAVEKQKTAKAAKRVAVKTASLSREMEKLKDNMEKLAAKKTPKKQLSEYNLFMRRQLNDGKTFNQAVKMWKAYKKGKPLIKTKVVRKTVVRKVSVPAKPKIKYRTRTVVRTVRAKPKIAAKARTVVKTVRVPATETIIEKPVISKKAIGVETMPLSDEELAVRLTSLYFEEIARMGFKRQLELEDVINAYYHALAKLKSRKIEASKEPIVVIQNQPITESKQ